jgi:hypothetical protein
LKLPRAHASCPSTFVSAPIQIVWLLLTDAARWEDFFDVRITRVEPAGSAVIGQRFYGESGPRFLHIRLKFEYTEVNEAQHRLGLNVQLSLASPFAKTWTAFPSATPDVALTTTATLASPTVSAVLSLAPLCAAISMQDRLARCHA